MKISSLKPGQVVWDVQRRKMGNTTISSTDVFKVIIQEVEIDGKWVIASWNGNPYRKFYNIRGWRKEKPLTIRTGFASQTRLANRAEIAEHKEKQAAMEGKKS